MIKICIIIIYNYNNQCVFNFQIHIMSLLEKIKDLLNKISNEINNINRIRSNTSTDLDECLKLDKEEIRKQLKAAANVEKRVKLFSKWMDKYWIDAIAWMIPAIWDLTPAIISTCYLLSEWIHIWLSQQECLKILWYQLSDIFVWSIPFIWVVADFFFKWNKYSAEIFSRHLEKLKKAALEKWISQEEIDNMGKRESRFLSVLNYCLNKGKNKEKKWEK